LAIWDAVVVGAGAAGLAAGEALARAGQRVLVVEARDRPGGRIETRREAGWPIPIEGGAEFEHGLPPAIERLRKQAGAPRLEHEQRHFCGDGHRLRSCDGDWRRAMELLEALPKEGGDRSYAELRRERWWRRRAPSRAQALALSFVEGFNAADASSVSVLSLGRQTQASADVEGDRLFRIGGGYDRIVAELVERMKRAGGELWLGTRVERIVHGRRSVEVHMRGATGERLAPVRARAAIVTLPVGVLQAPPGAAGAVRFSPSLPADKRRVLRATRMGPVVRIVLRFRRLPAKLVRHDVNFLHVPGAPVPTFWRIVPGDAPVLVGWSAGPSTRRLPSDESSRLRAALASLARGLCMPKDRVSSELEAWRIFDWQHDPFSRGAYTYVMPGEPDASAALAAPVGSSLFFAGEATHTGGATGTVHGALESGIRAAREVLGDQISGTWRRR
jgi:monoamine oxidase